MRAGRTYCVGLTSSLVDITGDLDTLGGGAGAAIQVLMDGLRGALMDRADLTQVVLSVRGPGGSKTFPQPCDVIGCGVYDRLGSQRRRARPD